MSVSNVVIYGNNTFSNLYANANTTQAVIFAANSNNTISTWSISGTDTGNVIILTTNSPTWRYGLIKSGDGIARANYLDINYSNATPATTTWYAGANSTDGGTNSGWIFTAPPATYSISPNVASVNEGLSVAWTITTTDFGSGTLYYTNSGTASDSDFVDGLNSGSITITNDSGTLTKTLVNDITTEGSETIVIQLRTDSTSGTIVATASSVTVNDTSITPPPPVARITKTGNILVANTSSFDEVTQTRIGVSSTAFYAAEFDEITLAAGAIPARFTKLGNVQIAGVLDEITGIT